MNENAQNVLLFTTLRGCTQPWKQRRSGAAVTHYYN